jgi:hypothetical protein
MFYVPVCYCVQCYSMYDPFSAHLYHSLNFFMPHLTQTVHTKHFNYYVSHYCYGESKIINILLLLRSTLILCFNFQDAHWTTRYLTKILNKKKWMGGVDGERRHSSTDSESRHKMKLNDKIHVRASLHEKEPLVFVGKGAGWVPGPFWASFRYPSSNRGTSRPYSSHHMRHATPAP